MKKQQKCPQCGGPIVAVRQSPNSPLNSDQFDASKAGDYYCETCPSNDRGQKPLCYWRERELPDVVNCKHENFTANVAVNRLEDIGRFAADVRIECVDCGVPMRFIGLPCGVDLNGAAVNSDATEARLAIAPKEEVIPPIEGGKPVGFSVRRKA